MPKKEVKPPPKPVLKGVVGVIVPKKAAETPTPVYRYLKENAEYSEKKITSTEDTKLFRLQIEQHLNDLRTQTDNKTVKTESSAVVDKYNDNLIQKTGNDETNINTCFNFIKKAVNEIEVVEKKNEKTKNREIPKLPKTNLLIPLAMVKEKEGDFFKGTKLQKEKKVKEKKPSKVIRLDDIKDVKQGETYQIDIQPVVVNRWQEKEGSKLFDHKPDPELEEEEALLQLVLKESLKTAKLEKTRWLQESLVHEELNREVKMDRGRGSAINNVLKDEEENACCMDEKFDDSTLQQLRCVGLPDGEDEWAMPVEPEKKVKENRVRKEKKPNLRQTLQSLDEYGPCDYSPKPKPFEDMVPKEQRLKKSDEKKIEGNLKKDSDELVFVDPEEEEEEEKAEQKSIQVKNETETKENNLSWMESNDLEFSTGKIRTDLPLIDTEARKEDTSENDLSNMRPRYKQKQVFWNSSVRTDNHDLLGGNQLTNNDRMKPRSDAIGRFSGNLNIEPPVSKFDKIDPKSQFWNSTAQDDKKGFSSDYQSRRRGRKDETSDNKTVLDNQNIFDEDDNVPKNSFPSKEKDFAIFEDIPEIENKNLDPFQDFEEDPRKVSDDRVVVITEQVIEKYLQKVLLQVELEKEVNRMSNQFATNANLQYQSAMNQAQVNNLYMPQINTQGMMNLPQENLSAASQAQNLYLLGLSNQPTMNVPQESSISPEIRDFFNNLPGLNREMEKTDSTKVNLLFDNKPKRQGMSITQTTDPELLQDLFKRHELKIPEDETHLLIQEMQELQLKNQQANDLIQEKMNSLQENLSTEQETRSNLNPTVPEFNVNKSDEDLSVEKLRLKIQQLEQELAKQQQELEARSESRSVKARSESSQESQNVEVEGEEGENQENQPYPGCDPYLPFHAPFIPPQGMYHPQMPVYYPYIPPYVPPMGPVPPNIPQMPYPMMLPVRPPYMPDP